METDRLLLDNGEILGKPRRGEIGARPVGLKGLERNYGPGVGDSWDDLDLMTDEMADIDIGFHVEFGQNVIVPSD